MSDLIVSANPANGEWIASNLTTPEADIEQGLKNALKAFVNWKTVWFLERSNVLLRAAAILHHREIASERLEAGSCFVNTFVRSDPRLPFGGATDSAYCREQSEFGIQEFVNVTRVYTAT